MTPQTRLRVALYLVLALLCTAFAVVLANSEKYGTTAAIFQGVLALIWLVAAFVAWKFG